MQNVRDEIIQLNYGGPFISNGGKTNSTSKKDPIPDTSAIIGMVGVFIGILGSMSVL